MVSDTERATIKAALEHSGEFTAMLEVQRMFKGITVDQARECVRIIETWKPPEPIRKRNRGRHPGASRRKPTSP